MTNPLTRVRRLEAAMAIAANPARLIVIQANSSEESKAVLGEAGFDADDPNHTVVRLRHFGPNPPDPAILSITEIS